MSSKMEVRIRRSTVIVATAALDVEPLPRPLTVFDRFAPDMHIAVLYAFSPPTPTNAELIESLSKTLSRHFRFLTARNPSLVLGGSDDGILVVEAEVGSSLDEHMPLRPSPELALLHPSTADASRLVQVQLNRFRGGGLVVGITNNHRVADGQSMSTFCASWGKVSRGIPVEPAPNQDLSWLKPRHPAECEFQHWGAEFAAIPPHSGELSPKKSNFDRESIRNVLLHYSAEFISSELKAGMEEKLTTFQALAGHLWRKITIARALKHGETTMMRVSVNGRPRLRPAVPNEFVGNLVLNAYPSADAGELIGGGLAGAARTVREAVRMINDRYFQSFIDFGQVHGEEKLVPAYGMDGAFLFPNLDLESWLGFQFQEVDFGRGGALCAFLPTWVSMDGLVILLPCLSEDGGVDVMVALLKEHAEILKKISHSLD